MAIVTSFARTVAIGMSIADRAPAPSPSTLPQRVSRTREGSTVARDARASIAIATAPIDARSIDDSRATLQFSRRDAEKIGVRFLTFHTLCA